MSSTNEITTAIENLGFQIESFDSFGLIDALNRHTAALNDYVEYQRAKDAEKAQASRLYVG